MPQLLLILLLVPFLTLFHSNLDPGYYYTPVSSPSYPTQDPTYQYPPYSSSTYDSGYTYPIVSSSPAYPSAPTYPVCEIEIITYVIEVVIITDDIFLNEFRYLIYTPAEGSIPFAFGSIGKSIYKPDAHPVVLWVTSGSLDDNTASLAEYYKGYPHDVAPSYSEAYYLWIYEYQIAVIYISLSPPAYAAYTEFGVDSEGHLTYGGNSYWALCPAPDCEDTWYVYWIGSGSAPYGCRTDVYLRLARYGFSSPKTYYENNGGNSGSYPPVSGSPSYPPVISYPSPYYPPPQYTTPTDPYAPPPYSTPVDSYYPPQYTTPVSYPSPYYSAPPYTTPTDPYSPPPYSTPVDSYYPSPYTTPVDPYPSYPTYVYGDGGSSYYPSPPSSAYYDSYGSSIYSDPYSSPSYVDSYDPSPTYVDSYYTSPSYPTPTVAPYGSPTYATLVTYPAYTSMVDGAPITEYETVTAYYTSDSFDEELESRPTLS
jgi:hypothetical protein